MYTNKLFESYNQQLNEKINKDHIEINRAIANPNAGKNADRIKQAGYDIEYDGDYIKNPKTGKGVWPKDYSRDEKKKVDFKGKLDSERKPTSKTRRFMSDIKDNKIPKSAKLTKDEYNSDEVEYYSPRYNNDPKKSISSNMNYYKKAVKDRDEARFSADRNKKGLSYYEKKVKDAQKDLDWQKDYIKDKEKEADWAENKRKAIIDNIRKRKTESEELNNQEFKVGDTVKVPYKYGSYTPGEFTEAPIIDISDDRYVTVEIPSKLEVTMEQLKKWNKGIDESIELTEEYSEKLGGEPEDFINDVETIKQTLSSIDTSKFGSHLAQQMVEDFYDTCLSQIDMTKNKYNL